MISIDEALRRIADQVPPLGTEDVPLEAALGRRLATEITSKIDLPPFKQSAMDGYAFHSSSVADGNQNLRIVGTQLAGPCLQLSPGLGECIRVTTGAVIPECCDTVVIQENTSVEEQTLQLSETPAVGANIRKQGEELQQGARLGTVGERLTPGHICAMSAAGVSTVQCVRRPKIAILVTGSEIIPTGTAASAGQVYNANGPWLKSWLEMAGVPAQSIATMGDSAEEIRHHLDHLSNDYDVIITTGGVSVGEADYIPRCAQQLNYATIFHKVAQKPGKPVFLAKRHSTLLLGLPGNPGSTVVCTALYLSAILSAFKQRPIAEDVNFLTLENAPTNNSNRDRLLRCVASGEIAELAKFQASHMVSNLNVCDVLVRIQSGYKNTAKRNLFPSYPLYPQAHSLF